MSLRTRNLLDRFRELTLSNVLIIDDSTLTIDSVIRMINTRHLTEAAELARIIYSEIKPNIVDAAVHSNDKVTEISELTGITYWNRQLLLQAARQNAESAKHPLTKAHDELQDAVKFIIRKVKSVKFDNRAVENGDRIRNFPQIVRTYYENADWILPVPGYLTN